jgi:pseudaminic acid cytidylyltransferase
VNIAIIPARSGSKRIPRKNVKQFCGRPIISYPVDAAIKSKLFSRIIVSTDDQEIAEIAMQVGAEVPFLRPPNLSDDHTPTHAVMVHAIKECLQPTGDIDYVCCIYPATPLLQASDLQESLAQLKSSTGDYCIAVAEHPSSIFRALEIGESGLVSPVFPQYRHERSQDLKQTFFDVGQFYWGKKESWIDNSNMHDKAVPFVIPTWRAIDIDNESDWIKAELIYKSS